MIGGNFRLEASYDTGLAANYAKCQAGAFRDLRVRAAQSYLTYLNPHRGTIDGICGRGTRSALNEFQEKNDVPLADTIGPAELDALRKAVEANSG